jgi:hypothetical protein
MVFNVMAGLFGLMAVACFRQARRERHLRDTASDGRKFRR